MLREIVLDTETTGLDHRTGDRIVEIGCLELVNRFPSGREWHHYFNPDRDMPREAFNVHGISAEFLKDKPRFKELAGDFVSFLGDAVLVIHNASFDIGFLNAELAKVGHAALSMDRAVDTLALARRKHPGAQATLDALCKRYGIDSTVRSKHGALVDCKLLAAVYVEMLGERQARLELASDRSSRAVLPGVASGAGRAPAREPARVRPRPLAPRLSADDLARHRAFVEQLGPQSSWPKGAGG